jgi:hypothetical protein
VFFAGAHLSGGFFNGMRLEVKSLEAGWKQHNGWKFLWS